MGSYSRSVRLCLSLSVGVIGGCREECRTNATWCDGDKLNRCEDTGNKVLNKRSLRTDDCSEEGLVCVPADLPYCGIPDFDCKGRIREVCAGTRIASCREDEELPGLIVDCGNQSCVELEGGKAICAESSERCNLSSPPKCEGGSILYCDKGAWQRGPKCFGACTTDGVERCENGLAPVRCMEGFWQATEDCFSPCKCAADSDAAVCVCE